MKYNDDKITKQRNPGVSFRNDYTVNVPLLLKKLKNHLGINTNLELALILDVKPNTISTWKRRNSIDYVLIISICNMLDIDLNSMFSTGYARSKSARTIVAVPIESQYQYVANFQKEEFLNKMPKCSLPFSLFNPDSRAFQMAGVSMSPTFREGAYVIGERIKDRNTIANNSVCILVSKLRGIHINRVIKDPGNPYILNLCNDNKSFSGNVVMPIEEITEAWRVTHTMSLDIIKEDL